mmetsp:Transcript_74218/g.120551  ORF Transcript_74218/g.120551 Transcript_74218/m.120551 type:complete len:106 (-) Transcript_74218:518-835(-)
MYIHMHMHTHTHRHRHSHSSAHNNAQLRQTTHEDSEQDQLDDIKKSLATLAGDTTKAIGALANEMDKEGKSTPQERSETQSLRRGTDEQIDTIMKQLSDLTYAQN